MFVRSDHHNTFDERSNFPNFRNTFSSKIKFEEILLFKWSFVIMMITGMPAQEQF